MTANTMNTGEGSEATETNLTTLPRPKRKRRGPMGTGRPPAWLAPVLVGALLVLVLLLRVCASTAGPRPGEPGASLTAAERANVIERVRRWWGYRPQPLVVEAVSDKRGTELVGRSTAWLVRGQERIELGLEEDRLTSVDLRLAGRGVDRTSIYYPGGRGSWLATSSEGGLELRFSDENARRKRGLICGQPFEEPRPGVRVIVRAVGQESPSARDTGRSVDDAARWAVHHRSSGFGFRWQGMAPEAGAELELLPRGVDIIGERAQAITRGATFDELGRPIEVWRSEGLAREAGSGAAPRRAASVKLRWHDPARIADVSPGGGVHRPASISGELDGVAEGLHVDFATDGRVDRFGQHVRGERQGLWYRFGTRGLPARRAVVAIEDYERGKLVSRWESPPGDAPVGYEEPCW